MITFVFGSAALIPFLTAMDLAAAITGSVLATVGILCTSNLWPRISQPFERAFGVTLPEKFWISQQMCAFVSVCIAGSVYVLTSLVTCRKPFNLDKMLHRGAYAVEPKGATELGLRERLSKHVLRFDASFTRLDKFTAGGIFW